METIWKFILKRGNIRWGLVLWGLIFFDSSVTIGQPSVTFPSISLTKEFSGLSLPVHITHAGDGSGRLFVVEQEGRIWILKNGERSAIPFLDIVSRVSCCGERGLLSVAFPPDYKNKSYFYVNYTNQAGNTVVARYHATANPDIAGPDSEEIVLGVDQPFANHNGGQLAFGPDGFLYIGMGDGGSGGDPQNHGQNPGSLLGKILRIDVESGQVPYGIPPDNPFAQMVGYRGEIWALGLRNPWRFSFDRKTGDLYFGDVGQNAYEEIDFQPSSSPGGENYGWRIMEGAHCFNPNPCDQTGLALPVVEYDHSQGCSVTGGMVYRGPNPFLQGTYFYGDFCSGNIWGLKYDGTLWQNALLLKAPFSISTFGEDEAGNLHVADYSGGNIYGISAVPMTLVTPADQTSFDTCSLYSLPTFRWSVGESFRNFEIQFSTDPAFQSIPVKVRLPGSFNEKMMNPSPWKRVLKLSGETGGTIYWRVTGAGSDRRIAESDIRSLIVEPALPVGIPTISGTAKSSLPTLSWENNCNKKFKVWFGGDDQFTTRVSFLFNVTDPTKNGGAFTKQLTLTQWMAVRRLVGDAGGSPISCIGIMG
jgi:glucose/arabinose dehydrogenase